MQKPLNRKAKTRVRLAFLFLFVCLGALSYGAYVIGGLTPLRESIAARERQAALQSLVDSKQIDEALRRRPSNKLLQMIAMAAKAADETSAAADRLLDEIEPATLAKKLNLVAASRADLEALRRDLKTADANATASIPRYTALVKAERERLEAYALTLHAEKDVVDRFLAGVDQREAEATALVSALLSARSEYYRAYEKYVGVLASEFGGYQVVSGQFIFPLQRTVERYNAAVQAMTAAAARVGELQDQRAALSSSQQAGWAAFVSGK